MVKNSVSEEQIKIADDYLRGYSLNQKLLRLDRYERSFFGYEDGEDGIVGDAALARGRMFEIRHLIMSLDNCDEKLLLYYHYIRGEGVEKCAELLGMSRSSAFRLKKYALAEAYLHSVAINKTFKKGMF